MEGGSSAERRAGRAQFRCRDVMLGFVLTCLDHIGLFVRDISAATRVYATLLGRSPTWRGVQPADGTENTVFRLENTSIELIASADDRSEGLGFLAFGTEDAADARDRCVAAGLDAQTPVEGLAQDTGSGAFRRFVTVELPPVQTGGVPIRLVEHRSPDAILQPAPATDDEAACIGALDHVVVMTEAPDRAVEFYRDRLGIRLALDRSFEKRGVRLLFFRIGDATVEIGASLDASHTAPGDDRLWGAAYRVGDVDAAHTRLTAAGVAVSDVRPGHKPGTRVFTIKGETHGVPTLIIGDD
jgi:catechol 2,3-dioxygenase-like lactoylglutathione lyase family enzyme